MKKLTKICLSASLGISLSILPTLISPLSAQAITWEEVSQMLGILHRYTQDIQKNLIEPRQRNSQPVDNRKPEVTPTTNEPNPVEIQIPE